MKKYELELPDFILAYDDNCELPIAIFATEENMREFYCQKAIDASNHVLESAICMYDYHVHYNGSDFCRMEDSDMQEIVESAVKDYWLDELGREEFNIQAENVDE